MTENNGDEENDIVECVRQLSLDKAKPTDEIQDAPQVELVAADIVAEVPRPLHRDSLYPHGQYAFHVTNIPVEDENTKPTITHLPDEKALHLAYDGVLCEHNAVGIFFATSLLGWCDPPCLPDRSPYPVGGTPGKRYWRAKVPLTTFNDYEFSYVSQHKKQLLLILTKGEAETERFRSLCGSKAPKIQALKKEDNPYLVYFDKTWYVNLYGHQHDPYVVGFFVPGDSFALSDDVEWDAVSHRPYEP